MSISKFFVVRTRASKRSFRPRPTAFACKSERKSWNHLFQNSEMGVFVYGAVLIGLVSSTYAATNRQVTYSRKGVPNRNYTNNSNRVSSRSFAVVIDSVLDDSGLRRQFNFRAISINVAHLKLFEVGLLADSLTGTVIANGRISHTGNDNGIKGSNVLISIRAYVANTANPSQIPQDSTVVWESKQLLWVPSGEHHFSLTSSCQTPYQREMLLSYFSKITHLEIEMEYIQDQ